MNISDECASKISYYVPLQDEYAIVILLALLVIGITIVVYIKRIASKITDRLDKIVPVMHKPESDLQINNAGEISKIHENLPPIELEVIRKPL